MSADDEDEIAKVRARVVAWNAHEAKRAAWIAAAPNPRIVESIAMTDARHAALDLGPLPTAGELALLARSDRLEALEKAILSSAGDDAQRDGARTAVVILEWRMWVSGDAIALAAAYLAQGKALADLRAGVLELVGLAWSHDATCEHANCEDPDNCADGFHASDGCDAGPGDSSPHKPCACYVADIDNLIKLAHGEAGEKEGD